MEWHNHERARNAWDIERAEMKAKFAKQEGETRSAKKLNEALDRQIRMLERALRAERAKSKVLMSGEKESAALEKALKEAEAMSRTEVKGMSRVLRRLLAPADTSKDRTNYKNSSERHLLNPKWPSTLSMKYGLIKRNNSVKRVSRN